MSKRDVITWVLMIAMAFGVWYLRTAAPLGDAAKVRGEDFTVEATLIREIPHKEADGSKTYTHEIISFTAEAGSEEAEELLQVMNEITCRSRWKVPFERATVYKTGQESVELYFRLDGRVVDLSMLSDAQTIYDLGSRSRQYSVSNSAFEELAACIEHNGEACPASALPLSGDAQ